MSLVRIVNNYVCVMRTHFTTVSPYEKESAVDESVSNSTLLPSVDIVEENVLITATDQQRM